jgi:hypothetical protein
MVMEQFVGGQGTSNKENEDPDGNGDWLHRNNSYQPHYVDVENISTQIPGVVLFNLLLVDLNIGSCILCIMLSFVMPTLFTMSLLPWRTRYLFLSLWRVHLDLMDPRRNPVIGLSHSPVQHIFIFLHHIRRSMMKDVMSYYLAT